MLSIKQKWTQLRTYQRLQRLWSDYVTAAEIGDGMVGQEKLDNFLDNFQSAYSEHAGALEKIFGDCTDILVALLRLVEKESETTGRALKVRRPGDESLIALAQVLNKALSVAELIVRDEKYRKFVKESPVIINNILSLLEKMSAKDSKKLALRLIYSLANEHDGKLAIGKNDGFRRIVRLLLEGDDDLTREILRTINHFLEDDKLRSMFELPPAQPQTGWAAFKQGFQKGRGNKNSSSLEFVRQKFETVVTDVTRLLSYEVNSALNEGGSVVGGTVGAGGGAVDLAEKDWFVVPAAEQYEQVSVASARSLSGAGAQPGQPGDASPVSGACDAPDSSVADNVGEEPVAGGGKKGGAKKGEKEKAKWKEREKEREKEKEKRKGKGEGEGEGQ